MRIVRDAPVAASDGLVLRADVFRPTGEGPFPAILSYGPYAKGMSFAESRPFAWQRLVASHPAAMAATSNKHQAWELPDPERWVRDGYAIVREQVTISEARPARTLSYRLRRTTPAKPAAAPAKPAPRAAIPPVSGGWLITES